MPWSGTYSNRVLVGLDQFGAAVLFNRNDACISSLCRIVQNADAGVGDFPARLASLNLKPWQLSFLRWLAPKLDKIEADHCELSRQGDLARAESTKTLLS
jgi:hypothetical protein